MNPRIGIAPLLLLSSAIAQNPPADPPPDPTKVEARPELSFFEGWAGSVELGLNGASGNSENLNFRAGAKAERKTEAIESKAAIVFTRSSQDGDLTQNRVEAGLRNDWIFADAPRWRYFLMGTYEFDDFQDWKHRVTIGNGVGYAFIKSDTTLLLGRLGVGVSREFGGSDNDWRPEGILGADLEHKFSERQKLTATVDFLPDLKETGPYRVRAAAAYELLVDGDSKTTLKLGVEDRYDSDPGAGRDRNDVTYFALLSWAF